MIMVKVRKQKVLAKMIFDIGNLYLRLEVIFGPTWD